jgi:uncharacterized protein YegL
MASTPNEILEKIACDRKSLEDDYDTLVFLMQDVFEKHHKGCKKMVDKVIDDMVALDRSDMNVVTEKSNREKVTLALTRTLEFETNKLLVKFAKQAKFDTEHVKAAREAVETFRKEKEVEKKEKGLT